MVTMTREEALLKLLALGPLTDAEIPKVTGWTRADADAVVRALHERQAIGMHRINGGNGPPMYFLGGDIAGRLPRGATGRAIANARRSSMLPQTPTR